MTDDHSSARLRRFAYMLRMRLVAVRWPLLAAIVLVVAVHIGGGNSLIPLVLSVIALVVLAAVPRRRPSLSRRAATPTLAARSAMSAEMLAEAVSDPLIIMNSDGGAVHTNAAARAAFGNLPGGMELVLKFRAPEVQDLLDRVRSGEVASGSVDYAERVPFERVYQVSASAVGHATGLFVVIFRDQSESRRIDRMRADFIANASHELRTPLASISGFIETLRGPARNDAAARDRFLGIMQAQTQRMSRLIDDLLSLSRLEMKPQIAAGGTVDLAEIVRAVVAALAPMAADAGVTIETEIAPGAYVLAGDRDELFQVLENLVENACKYGQDGGRAIVRLERVEDGGEPAVALSVQDFGPGIAARHIPRITERFYRIDQGSGKARKGTGLGLAIVKHIATRHGARLVVRSEPGQGSTFAVHFPDSAARGHLPAN